MFVMDNDMIYESENFCAPPSSSDQDTLRRGAAFAAVVCACLSHLLTDILWLDIDILGPVFFASQTRINNPVLNIDFI